MRALLLPALLLGLAAPTTPQLTTYANDALHFSFAYPSDHDAAFVQGSTTGGPDGKTGYAGTACAAVEQHAICWTAMSQDKTRIAVLLASQVTFSGRPPAAIVPAATFAK